MAGEPSHYEAVLSLQLIADRIERASDRNTLPYFIRDNRERVERLMAGEERRHYGSDHISQSDIERNRKEYESFSDDWIKVLFNEENCGYNVYHKNHQFAPMKAEKIIDGNTLKSEFTGGDAEKIVGRILCDINGKCVKFLPENGNNKGKPDLEFDGQTWDVKYIPLANENTIRKYIKDAEKAQNVIFFFDRNSRLQDLHSAVNREVGSRMKSGKLDKMPGIYYLTNTGELTQIRI